MSQVRITLRVRLLMRIRSRRRVHFFIVYVGFLVGNLKRHVSSLIPCGGMVSVLLLLVMVSDVDVACLKCINGVFSVRVVLVY